MTLPDAVLTQGVFSATSGQWEAGQNSRARRTHATRLVSHDTDLSNGTREMIMSKARLLNQNTPLPGAINRRFADYCVHPDALVTWTTQDREWNRRAADAWYYWTRSCDATGEMTLAQMLRAAVQSKNTDGDTFLYKEANGPGDLKLRGIEADRITNAKGGATSYDNPKPSNERRDIGGVIVNAQGVKVAYTLCDRTGYGSFTNPRVIAAANLLHYHGANRFESYRGVSAFHSVLNSLDDLKETLDAEQLAQKVASSLTVLERTANGPAGNGIPNAFSSGETDNAGNVRQLEDMAAGIKRYLAHGDSLEMFTSRRPEEGWRWLIEFLIRGVSLGLHLPYEFTWNLAGLTGTSVRLVSKLAERTFNAEMDNLEHRVIDPIVAWWVTDQMEAGKLPFNPEWMFYKAARPAHPTVDVGRESSANLAELNAGVRTEDQICSEQGLNGYDVRVMRKDEVMHRLQMAKEIVAANPDVPFSQALALMGGNNIGQTYNMQPGVTPIPATDETKPTK